MNYYAPRELLGPDGKGTGKWHYTVMNDKQVYPVGYCNPWQKCTKCDGERKIPFGAQPDKVNHCSECGGVGIAKLPDDKKCPGHNSPEEACEHQRQYELDHATYHQHKDCVERAHQLERCEVCKEFTAGFAMADQHYYFLCENHCNRENLEKLVSVGTSMSS